MAASKIIISPKTKVGELLDNYPDLESVLMEMSPAFEKLRNPVLRKTVARVATLQQVDSFHSGTCNRHAKSQGI